MISEYLEPIKMVDAPLTEVQTENIDSELIDWYRQIIIDAGYWVYEQQPTCPNCGTEIEP